VEKLRQGFTRYAPLGALVALVVVAQIALAVWARRLGLPEARRRARPRRALQHPGARRTALYAVLYPFEVAAVILLVAIVAAITLTMRRRPGQKLQDVGRQVAVRARDRIRVVKMDTEAGSDPALPRAAALRDPVQPGSGRHLINRKNVLLLLMCIELMLLAVNFNFIAFAHHLGDLAGQVFVFFILTVAAAESAIGLAILVVLFRQRRSINVEELDAMRAETWNRPSSRSFSRRSRLRAGRPVRAPDRGGRRAHGHDPRRGAVVRALGEVLWGLLHGGAVFDVPSTPGSSATASAWRSASWSTA